MAAAGVVVAVACGVGVGVGVGLTQRRHGKGDAADAPTGRPFVDSFAAVPSTWRVDNGRANGGAYLCGFTKDAVAAGDNVTTLAVLAAPYVDRAYGCAQLVHDDTYLYGSYAARLQAARGPGVVTAFFTYVETTPDVNQEIDVEFVGADTTVLWASTWRDGRNFTQALPLGFDAAAAAHTYRFVWQAQAVAFFADDRLLLNVTDEAFVPQNAPTRLYVSTWLRAPNAWVGS